MLQSQGISMRPLSRGDIVLVLFPFTGLSATKRRPAVVLWADPMQIDFTVAFMSSQSVGRLGLGEAALLPAHPEFVLTGLRGATRIRANKIVTLSRSLITRWLGRLGPLLAQDLDRALVAALSINTVPYREEGRNDERARLVALCSAGKIDSVLADLGLPII